MLFSLYPGSGGDAGDTFESLHHLLDAGPWTGSVFAACSAHLIVLMGFENLTLNDEDEDEEDRAPRCVLESQVIRKRHHTRGHGSSQVSGSLSRSRSYARSQHRKTESMKQSSR